MMIEGKLVSVDHLKVMWVTTLPKLQSVFPILSVSSDSEILPLVGYDKFL